MMTTGPTPVEAAKRVLMILVGILHRMPGDAVRLDTVQTQFLSDAWTLVDFQTGLTYAAQRRWIEMRDREAVLTKTGFAKV
jgi:hypothetical protein